MIEWFYLRIDTSPPLPVEEIRRLIQDYLSWEVVVNTPASVIQVLEIEVHNRISFWEALILQAAESSGAAILYSEDLAAGQKYGPIQVINPLLGLGHYKPHPLPKNEEMGPPAMG
jgi:predicted nucleic acid-binding protein